MGVDQADSDTRRDTDEGGTFRMSGSLTIARAASTQRELDAAADPLTIDLPIVGLTREGRM